ncbi:MAG: hypothetical protein F2813_01130 [Actinobacteria bacterium]|uniref:Unannotated protein n=1 Tax=freshwater metagenome TaxID=449393 RepID=A0A6J5Z890_9ZZZZ|nr:hypothetical protein [Actinomycetota bacterium]
MTELSGNQEPFKPMLAEHGAPCHDCQQPMAGDQRYCLGCGARRGDARLDPLEQAKLLEPAAALVAAPLTLEEPLQPSTTVWEGFPLGGLDFGGARAVAGAVLGVMVVGVVLGVVAGPKASSTNASGNGQQILVAQNPQAATGDANLGADTLGNDVGSATDSGSLSGDTVAVADVPVSSEPTTGGGGGSGGGGGGGGGGGTTTKSAAPLKHVWVVTLSGPSYQAVYSRSRASKRASAAASSYLGTELRAKGTLLPNYGSVSASALANSIALISGQPPNPSTERNCPVFTDVTPGKVDSKTGLVSGDGCRYPPQTKTLPDQMTGAGMVWKGYFESIGNDPDSGVTSCRHPEAGKADPFFTPRPGDAYLTWRNPFVYFRSITESADCGSGVVGLDRLAPDLKTLDDTPALSLVVPDACHDGSSDPCEQGKTGGIAASDEWLKLIVESITASDAYADGGMVVITSDHSAAEPKVAEAKVGALLLSPYVAAGTSVDTSYNHYSLLKTIELAFGLDALGKAAKSSVKPFDSKVFANAPAAGSD